MRKFSIEKARVNGEVISECLTAFTPQLLETTKIVDFDTVNDICIKWSNKMQYDNLSSKKEVKAWDEEKLDDLKKQDWLSWIDTEQFHRSICIGVKWSFGTFGVPEWYSDIDKVMRNFIKNETDDNKKVLADAINKAFDNLAIGHMPEGFSFNLSKSQAVKLAYACYPARAKMDNKKEISYILENRLKLDKCYELFCIRFVSLLGISKDVESKTKTVAYMA